VSVFVRVACYVFGLALGARIGMMAAGRPVTLLDVIVTVVLLLGSALVLLVDPCAGLRDRPPLP
jgi:hypothetical protein